MITNEMPGRLTDLLEPAECGVLASISRTGFIEAHAYASRAPIGAGSRNAAGRPGRAVPDCQAGALWRKSKRGPAITDHTGRWRTPSCRGPHHDRIRIGTNAATVGSGVITALIVDPSAKFDALDLDRNKLNLFWAG
jgi:hypothetical protein